MTSLLLNILRSKRRLLRCKTERASEEKNEIIKARPIRRFE